MVTMLDAILWFFIFVLLLTIYWYASIPKNLPPGPIGLPLLGSSLDYLNGSTQAQILQEQVKQYGPLFKIYIANKLVLVLGDYDTIQEAIVKQADAFAGRPQLQGLVPEQYRHYGLILSEGDLWKEQRRFSLSTLRDFGVGRPIMESRIKEELEHLIQRMSDYSSDGGSFNPQMLITCAVSNIISAIVFGKRFDYDNQEFERQFMALSKRMSGAGLGFLSPVMLSDIWAPVLAHVPKIKQMRREVDEFIEFVEAETKATMSTFDSDSDPTNYIHSFMKAASENQGASFKDAQLHAAVMDLFFAGSETTSTTLRWAILFLAHNPDVQEKMYQEIKNQVGVSSLPDYAEKTKLPFTEAVVMETQRLADLAPMGVLRRTLGPTKLMGYDIPDNTIVVPLLHNVLHNPDLYPDPSRFDPYRFLDNGKVNRDPKMIPFQAGKRVCLGESLARMELFLLLAGLVSRFRFYFPSDFASPTLKPIIGFTCTPTPYRVCVETRRD